MFIARIYNGKIEYNNIGNATLSDFAKEQGWQSIKIIRKNNDAPEYAKNIREELSIENDILTISYSWDEMSFGEFYKIKSERLCNEYITDIAWTDGSKMFYEKWKACYPADTSKDAWYSDIIKYWSEARQERENNKMALKSSGGLAVLSSITYNPTHIKTRTEIESH